MAVHVSGPLFDGRAMLALDNACDQAQENIARRGADIVRVELHRVLRNPTGYYESNVQAERHGASDQVTDRGVVYGPWLEGTGSRNRTTRFKGYSTFRRVTPVLQRIAGPIVVEYIARHLGEMG